MITPLYQIDAFTDQPFGGNPAGVCVLAAMPEAAWMQAVAAEMNLSETAFLVPREDEAFDLRWFTPLVEVDLCGHATLAAAHAMWSERHFDRPTIEFRTRSGTLTAHRSGESIELDFPARPAREVPVPGLREALGAWPSYVGVNEEKDILAEISDEAAVRALEPDQRRLEELPARGIIVTGVATSDGYDFVSRFFAPQVGIDEDPVTGSAHCCLAPYWAKRLGKAEMVGFQASTRGGVVGVRVAGDRVVLSGQAVTVMRGELGG